MGGGIQMIQYMPSKKNSIGNYSRGLFLETKITQKMLKTEGIIEDKMGKEIFWEWSTIIMNEIDRLMRSKYKKGV